MNDGRADEALEASCAEHVCIQRNDLLIYVGAGLQNYFPHPQTYGVSRFERPLEEYQYTYVEVRYVVGSSRSFTIDPSRCLG